jgi:hypothetical protein
MEGDAVNLKGMLDDQRTFNRQIWKDTEDDRVREPFLDRLRHLALGMFEETGEFLNTFEWKSHRRKQGKLQNVAHSHEELVDMFKYWLSMADLADFPIEELESLYYAKSRVVQYRYQEEWLQTLDGPCVLVDIDNVLADYIRGICLWAKDHAPSLLKLPNPLAMRLGGRLDSLRHNGGYVNAESTGLTPAEWGQVKHAFRTQGGKLAIPVFEDAKPFLTWCRQRNWKIILVTSRPIDRYPNIFTDTLTWLHTNDLPFDYLWWADDKARRLEEYEHVTLRSHVVFAVDDDMRFVNQYREKNIKTYWLCRQGTGGADNLITRSLTQIIEREGEDDGRLR